MTSSPYGLYELGYICATMDFTIRSNNVSWSESFKNILSSDCFLQLENMKSESLVIVNQHVTVNLYLDLVHTARHAWEVSFS